MPVQIAQLLSYLSITCFNGFKAEDNRAEWLRIQFEDRLPELTLWPGNNRQVPSPPSFLITVKL